MASFPCDRSSDDISLTKEISAWSAEDFYNFVEKDSSLVVEQLQKMNGAVRELLQGRWRREPPGVGSGRENGVLMRCFVLNRLNAFKLFAELGAPIMLQGASDSEDNGDEESVLLDGLSVLHRICFVSSSDSANMMKRRLDFTELLCTRMSNEEGRVALSLKSRNEWAATPLLYALRFGGGAKLVKILIGKGASTLDQDIFGKKRPTNLSRFIRNNSNNNYNVQ